MSDADRLRAAWGRLSYQVAIENDDFYRLMETIFVHPAVALAAMKNRYDNRLADSCVRTLRPNEFHMSRSGYEPRPPAPPKSMLKGQNDPA